MRHVFFKKKHLGLNKLELLEAYCGKYLGLIGLYIIKEKFIKTKVLRLNSDNTDIVYSDKIESDITYDNLKYLSGLKKLKNMKLIDCKQRYIKKYNSTGPSEDYNTIFLGCFELRYPTNKDISKPTIL
ncbi:hypothetical protein K502DRAFT_349826 [Neoconidiobolus thromboides FSU 785]|nr:hypothetical protein K502DRAFT_349826 [Neoconidiobolus thromboides FSU 785]